VNNCTYMSDCKQTEHLSIMKNLLIIGALWVYKKYTVKKLYGVSAR
jgi:hypothetical protein